MLNQLLDTLPRTRLGTHAREVPAFRTCGVTGFYAAVVVALAGGLLAGRSLPVVAMLCLVCGLSFFAYTYLRRAVTGGEKLVLLEHVWFAEACAAAALWLLDEQVKAYLDVIAPAMAVFLAGGRTGCLLVGCCHGKPSSFGVAYGEAHVEDGFPRELVGVRLFPVQALEALGLLAIAFTGLAALPWAPPGRVFAWFLAAYAILRFGTEALRGDVRPHWLGLSVPRWMSLAELALALWIGRGGGPAPRDLVLLAVLVAGLAAALAARRSFDARPRLLSPAHLGEVRDAVLAGPAENGADASHIALRTTSCGVAVGVSRQDAFDGAALQVSLSLPEGRRDLPLLCELAAGALPGLQTDSGRISPSAVLQSRPTRCGSNCRQPSVNRGWRSSCG
ncbi:MAG TPA: prolipoprotein diacylglyceryl transferase family protein, partial [Longimicrobiaceae bacterium]|nr:prolipoprotein diacylglyceryl transferase family protein [Longimicrobiaceae bacterium]